MRHGAVLRLHCLIKTPRQSRNDRGRNRRRRHVIGAVAQQHVVQRRRTAHLESGRSVENRRRASRRTGQRQRDLVASAGHQAVHLPGLGVVVAPRRGPESKVPVNVGHHRLRHRASAQRRAAPQRSLGSHTGRARGAHVGSRAHVHARVRDRHHNIAQPLRRPRQAGHAQGDAAEVHPLRPAFHTFHKQGHRRQCCQDNYFRQFSHRRSPFQHAHTHTRVYASSFATIFPEPAVTLASLKR